MDHIIHQTKTYKITKIQHNHITKTPIIQEIKNIVNKLTNQEHEHKHEEQNQKHP